LTVKRGDAACDRAAFFFPPAFEAAARVDAAPALRPVFVARGSGRLRFALAPPPEDDEVALPRAPPDDFRLLADFVVDFVDVFFPPLVPWAPTDPTADEAVLLLEAAAPAEAAAPCPLPLLPFPPLVLVLFLLFPIVKSQVYSNTGASRVDSTNVSQL